MREPWLQDIAEQLDPFFTKESRDQAQQECWRKVRFYSESEVREQSEKRRRRQKDDGPPIHYYQCRYEGLGRHWHIGHESAKYSERKESE